ncbi:hypothetical protein D3C75_715580 [compost metagenome]
MGFFGAFHFVIHPFFHGVPIFLQNAFVSIHLPKRPRHDDNSIAPTGRTFYRSIFRIVFFRFRIDSRRNIVNQAIFSLLYSYILQPFGHKRVGFHQHAACMHKNLDISRPSGSFTLRTIRRDIQKVPFLTPERILHKLIHKIIRTIELAGFRKIRIHGDGVKMIRSRLFRPVLQQGVPESMDCKPGFIHFSSIPA